MTHWYDKAEDRLEKELENGEITDKEYKQQMRDLNAELRGQAEEEAEQAFNDVMGRW